MKVEIDKLGKDTRRLYRHVSDTNMHKIGLTFLCKISKRDEHLVVVNEAKQLVSTTNGNLMNLADELRSLRLKYRHFGCVGYTISKKEVEN